MIIFFVTYNNELKQDQHFYRTDKCWILSNIVKQHQSSVTVELGASVTLECLLRQTYPNSAVNWFKQVHGQSPTLIGSVEKNISYYNEFKNNERFSIAKRENNLTYFTISNIQWSDIASYYCGIVRFKTVIFGNGTFIQPKANETAAEKPNPGPCEGYGLLTVLALGGMSAVLLIIIVVLVYQLNKRRRYNHSTGHVSENTHQASHSQSHDDQRGSSDVLTYAALEFYQNNRNTGKKRREMRKESEHVSEYAAIRTLARR
ncbi:uncharacterized protein [Lepisosteus oculatus]|uniref:uncharacterized protein n=1 Tax=Lepisosteus oculatus TaxID=7918 RepID=UPI0035F50D21